MFRFLRSSTLVWTILWFAPGVVRAQRQMESLGRGVTAMRTGNASAYVSWRMLGSDADDVAFNIYRSTNGGTPVKLNASPLTATTDYQDSPGSTLLNGSSLGYSVRPVVNGVEQAASASWTLPAGSAQIQYYDVPFAGDPGPDGPYDTKFAWVGDFDGDGEYDFLCDRLSTLGNGHEQFLEAYLRDGTFLWRMHMGPNSLDQSNSYEPAPSAISIGDCDNVTCFDLNGDGHAEAIVRTANGVTVTNAAGTTVAGITASNNNDQFLTVIDGMTGTEMDSIPLPNAFAQFGPYNSRFLIAYLDGKRPSIVVISNNRDGSGPFYRQWTAFDFNGGSLSQRWTWLQPPGVPGAEGHQIRVGDIDNDGRDEIIDIGHVVDDDGSGLYVTELTHGDRFHVADINPLYPGLETYAIQQLNTTFLATAYMNSATGEFYRKWYSSSLVDVGRGLTVDMVPDQPGMEMFSTQSGIFNAEADEIYTNSIFPFEGLWWDGDRGREFIMGPNSGSTSPAIEKFNPASGGNTRIYLGGKNLYDYSVHNAFGGRPAFWGDILGDWREELVLAKNDYTGLRVFTTTTPAQDRRRTLMHNAQYRVQATTKGYVQASYVDYYLGFESTEDPPSPINDTDHIWVGEAPVFDNTVCPTGESILFDLSGDNSSPVLLSGSLAPSRVKVFSPIDYVFDGAAGSFSGPMRLVKSGAGSLTLSGVHPYSGSTEVWDGALVVNGTLSASPVTIHGGTWGAPLARGETGGRLEGEGTVSQPVTLAWRGAIAPGAGNGHAATIHLGGGLTCAKDTALSLDVSNASASDLIAITGNLTLQGTTTLVIHPLDGTLAPGTHTLVTYTGAFNGTLGNLAVDLPAGTPYSLANPPGAITLTIPVTRAPGAITWKGGANGNIWDLFTTQNFLSGSNPDYFVTGDNVTFSDSGSPNTTVSLAGDLSTGGVTVDSSLDYQFTGTGAISGGGGLTKSGSGTLITGDNHGFMGPVVINGGTVSITALADGGSPSSLGAAGTASANLVLDGGTIRHDGPQTSTNRGMRLGVGGGTLHTPSASLQIGGAIDGAGALTKTGAGLLIIGGSNSYSGGTFINQGTIQLATDTANEFGLGTGSITFNGGTLSMTSNSGSYNSATYHMVVPAGQTGRLNADARVELSGTLAGSGDFTIYIPYVRTDLQGDWSGFNGALHVISDADGGDFRIDNNYGYGGAALDLEDGVYAYYMGTSGNPTIAVGTLSGSADAVLQGGASGTTTWQVGARNEDSTFAGPIVNKTGTTALTKIGTGTLTLGGACTYTGATVVSAGRLRVDGSTGGGNLTIQSGGILGGTGSITGNVAIQNGGGLEAAQTPLSITGNLTFTGAAVVRARDGMALAAGTYTVLTYTGSLTGSPALTWVPPQGSVLQASFNTSAAGAITMTLAEPERLPGPIDWTGTSSFNWDGSTANWVSGAQSTSYQDDDTPRFTDLGNASSAINLMSPVSPAAVVVDASKNYTISGAGSIEGAASLTKSGTGTLTLSSANAYEGGTVIHAGTVAISNPASLGTGAVTLDGGVWATGALSPQNPIWVTANSTITGGHSGGNHAVKNISGTGVLTLDATNVFDLEGDISGFAGTFVLSGSGSFRFFSTTYSGSSAATFDLGVKALTARQGSSYQIGALFGQPGSFLGMASNNNSSTCTYTIGGNNLDSSFSGVIANGSASKLVAIVKTGPGNLTLSGANTYTGATTVSSGKLTVNGSLSNTATTVGANATLGGNGNIVGTVICNGTLAPGSPDGTLGLGNALTLASTSVLDFELGTSSDLVTVSGNLTLDGTLNVSGLAGFGAGTYRLISYSGTLTNHTLSLGSLPSGYSASIDTATAGQVNLVVTPLNAPPQIITAAAATPSEVTTTSTGLSVAATDDAGEGNLAYTWTSSGPAAVVFAPNGTNSAKSATATFSAPGVHTLTVAVSDAMGLQVESSTSVTVVATPTNLTVNPPSATVPVGSTSAFNASVTDQFGNPLAGSIEWSSSGGGGSVDQSGSYTATATGGPWLVTATSGSLSGTAAVSVTKGSAAVALENLFAVYDGTPKGCTATTAPAGLNVAFTYDGSAAPPVVPGSYVVGAMVEDPNYAGSASGTLVISPRSFLDWETTRFSPQQILAGESSPDADPDGDGLANLAEYALGGDPHAFTPQPSVTRNGSGLSITFQRPAHVGDVSYHAEASPDLANWQELTLEVLNPGSDPEFVRAVKPLVQPEPHTQYLRLRFTR